MDIRVHARGTELDSAFRTAAEEKLQKAAKIFDHAGDLDVELTEEHNPRRTEDRYRLELTSLTGGRMLRIETAAPTPEAALDDAVDRFTRTLRRHKERLIDGHRKRESLPPVDEPVTAEPEIVRLKQFVMKPMNIDEAVLQMELLGHDFFFFHHSATDKNSVLYRRNDGRLGLIEPA
ncbi:MAG TPA: HPF/RaiA family ribosome-associated protein [Acidimicrobiia bacterium]|nr:HPF/RaiA family ribosome-associated protein [Acidimicrobiia bacterium]